MTSEDWTELQDKYLLIAKHVTLQEKAKAIGLVIHETIHDDDPDSLTYDQWIDLYALPAYDD